MKLDGKHLWDTFDQMLAPYAQKNAASQGRMHPEKSDPDRLPFQRDRDRIIHCPSFRRLRGKTQVVSPAFGDHFRNRLSHTIEVAQLARDLARQLKLNEDLAEAIALAHDLGHPPFGHGGEEALAEKMQEHGQDFNHNHQSLRVVTQFEQRYADFPGLNLTKEVLEGIQKHETFFDRPEGKSIFSPHLESQLVNLADEIAYLSADIEDGLRGGFFATEDLEAVAIAQKASLSLSSEEKTEKSALQRRIIRHLLSQIVEDTNANIHQYAITSLSDVQQCAQNIVAFSADFAAQFTELKEFLFAHYYLSPKVKEPNEQGKAMLRDLFDYFLEHLDQIPTKAQASTPEQQVGDYIAGMTDNFAVEQWQIYWQKA